jgi:UDP-N-acetylmuramate dehydrogenase
MAETFEVLRDHPVPTWFGIGGKAARFAAVHTSDDLRRALELDANLRVLGDGANLLVDDDGVDGLVVTMTRSSLGTAEGELPPGDLREIAIDEASGLVRVGAGVNLPKLITECVRRGLEGIEPLAGIPATIGGALVMNAGGSFGQIADTAERVFALDRAGKAVTLERGQISFDYRSSGLNPLLITGAELRLRPVSDQAALRARLVEVMKYKKESQPMSARSAGCAFKNPVVAGEARARVPGLAPRGQRVSAGLLIDRAGLKGLRVGGAHVSDRHANFLVTDPGATARDVISLMAEVERRVREAFGIELQREVVVWSRHGAGGHG